MKYLNVPRVVLGLFFSYFTITGALELYPFWKKYNENQPIYYTYLHHQSFDVRNGTSYMMEYEYKGIKRRTSLSRDEYMALAVSNELPTLYSDSEGTVCYTQYGYKKKRIELMICGFVLVMVILPIEFILVYVLNRIYPG